MKLQIALHCVCKAFASASAQPHYWATFTGQQRLRHGGHWKHEEWAESGSLQQSSVLPFFLVAWVRYAQPGAFKLPSLYAAR